MMTRRRVRTKRRKRSKDSVGYPIRSRSRSTELDKYVKTQIGESGFNKDGSIKARTLWKLALSNEKTPTKIAVAARKKLDKRGLDRIPERFTPETLIDPDQLVELQRIHLQRSLQAQLVDEGMKAKIAESVEEWIKEPNRSDIVGVDYPGKTQSKPSLEELQTIAVENIPEKPIVQKDGKQPKNHWLPEPLKKELENEFKREEDMKTGIALIKYFTPDGSATWYLSEYMPEDDVFYGYCDMGNGYPELGYVSRKELRETRGKMGLHIERDYYFTPKTLNEVRGDPKMPAGYWSIAEQREKQ